MGPRGFGLWIGLAMAGLVGTMPCAHSVSKKRAPAIVRQRPENLLERFSKPHQKELRQLGLQGIVETEKGLHLILGNFINRGLATITISPSDLKSADMRSGGGAMVERLILMLGASRNVFRTNGVPDVEAIEQLRMDLIAMFKAFLKKPS